MSTAAMLSTQICRSSYVKTPTLCTLSTSSYSISTTTNINFSWIHQLGPTSFSQWSCLRPLGTSISQLRFVNAEKRRKFKRKGVYASLFGVGAPEALVIGVVALLVFGPKGLAEAARTLGKTVRAFQPTIKELQDVSREFKSTLEAEIGLDDIRNPIQSTTNVKTNPLEKITAEDSQMKVDPMTDGSPSTKKAYSSEDLLKITEEQLKAAATVEQKQIIAPGEDQSEAQTRPQDTVQEDATEGPPSLPQESKSET
ncbi:sec-independent protein translocase protein TATB, chloroplastic isoform X1 [Daucus carota subsp. sativus]|uniref:sec-independent protein translocase protein TATB, chloroplastic isoform X1 n=1 Tax=Daucus carota subsp. sativus TaxID=79200 RepID=UPI0007EFD3E6|nr:PREDICTED: sec-independent protein translocase protein TATB, chloroplastic isoform X1 [Daucus carota subsp. sativus]